MPADLLTFHGHQIIMRLVVTATYLRQCWRCDMECRELGWNLLHLTSSRPSSATTCRREVKSDRTAPPNIIIIIIIIIISSSSSSNHRGCTWRKKCFPLYNLPSKMAAAFHGLITNVGLMAAGMSYSYSSQKQTTSLYVYMTSLKWRRESLK